MDSNAHAHALVVRVAEVFERPHGAVARRLLTRDESDARDISARARAGRRVRGARATPGAGGIFYSLDARARGSNARAARAQGSFDARLASRASLARRSEGR